MQLAPDAVLGEIGNQPMIFRIKHWETSPAVRLETQSWILLMVFMIARIEGSNVEQTLAATLIKWTIFLLASLFHDKHLSTNAEFVNNKAQEFSGR
jgi:hypothetical protein